MTSSSGEAKKVVVGVVGRPWGVKGQFLLEARVERTSIVIESGTVLVRPRGSLSLEERRIAASHHAGGRLVLHLEGCASVEDAESLRGAEVLVDESALGPVGDGGYYPHQLVGLAVETGDGKCIGTVSEVLSTKGVALLRVASPGREHLVPFAASICTRIDTARGRIEIEPPDGLLELSE